MKNLLMNLIKLKKQKKNVDRRKLVSETKTDTYDFRTIRTIRTFGGDIQNEKITLEDANESQANLAEEIVNFTNKTRPKAKEKKKEKEITGKNLHNFYNG